MIVALFVAALFVAAEAHPRVGLTADFFAPRVIGGQDATKGMVPWQLSMEFGASHRCGAMLIASTYALSAAHCTAGIAPGSLEIFLGMVDREGGAGDGDYEQVLSVTNIVEHPEYAPSLPGFPNDICVMTLGGAANVSSNVAIIPRPPAAGHPIESMDCWISGWGIPDSLDANAVTRHLRFAQTQAITLEECEVRMVGVGGAGVYSTHACIFNDDTGACNGDSGGPLSCRTNNGTTDWIAAGVCSWVVRDSTGCTPDYPSAYSRVSEFLQFISDNCGGC
eukprot:GHVU01095741.1.p1 GENE.GHVU01095741.1~~GHVU01095741.1.p1  ORF type:complete len:287 (+),score=15.66 GHVU01095741.1:27-863(+)